jgi:hypothetical protein
MYKPLIVRACVKRRSRRDGGGASLTYDGQIVEGLTPKENHD